MIPDERSYCEIDRDQKDDFGIPVLQFHFRWGDNELMMARLLVTDGACFTTNPDKNPTLTILAISWRAAEYLANEAQKGNL